MPLKNRLLYRLARRPNGLAPERLAAELLHLDRVPTPLALRLLDSVAERDPRVHIAADGVRLADPTALDLFRQEFAVIDIETTGLTLGPCRITEVAVVVVRGNGDWLDEMSSLVNPGRPIPPAIARMTGITDEMVAGAPTAASLLPVVLERLDQRTVVAHNATFDRRFIGLELSRAGLPPAPRLRWLCTRHLARRIVPALPSYGLDGLQRHFAIDNPTRHRALGDARTTARVLLDLLPGAAARGCRTPDDLIALTRRGPKS